MTLNIIRYALPKILISDAFRVLNALGKDFSDELLALEKEYGKTDFLTQKKAQKMGRVVFIHLNGSYKIDRYWEYQNIKRMIRIAYPMFISIPSKNQHSS